MDGAVLFIIQPATGHINASLSVAKILRENKLRVAFAGVESMHPLLKQEKFKFYKLQSLPFGIGHEKFVLNEEGKTSYLDNLLLRLSDRLFLERKKEIQNLLGIYHPDYVFIDPFLSTDLIILYEFLAERKIKIVFLQTMLPTCKALMFPPLSSSIIPRNSVYSKALVYLAWIRRTFHFRLWRVQQFLKFLGNDDVSSVKRKIRKQKIPSSMHLEEPMLFNFSFKGIPELILAPQELEFSFAKARSNHYYIGSLIDEGRKVIAYDPKYKHVENILILKKKNVSTKVIYCSFGSRSHLFPKLLNSFFGKLFKIIREKPEYFMVVSVPEGLLSEYEVSSNIFILNNVDQLSILGFSDLFITHGGLNSIKESIHFKVPMLVYPLELHGDQPGNAARVLHHKLGLRGDLDSESLNLMESKINEILNNDIYKQLLARFAQGIQEKYTAKNFLALFELISSDYYKLTSIN